MFPITIPKKNYLKNSAVNKVSHTVERCLLENIGPLPTDWGITFWIVNFTHIRLRRYMKVWSQSNRSANQHK